MEKAMLLCMLWTLGVSLCNQIRNDINTRTKPRKLQYLAAICMVADNQFLDSCNKMITCIINWSFNT